MNKLKEPISFSKKNAIDKINTIIDHIISLGVNLSDAWLVFHPAFESSVFTREQIAVRNINGLKFIYDLRLMRNGDVFDAGLHTKGNEPIKLKVEYVSS